MKKYIIVLPIIVVAAFGIIYTFRNKDNTDSDEYDNIPLFNPDSGNNLREATVGGSKTKYMKKKNRGKKSKKIKK